MPSPGVMSDVSSAGSAPPFAPPVAPPRVVSAGGLVPVGNQAFALQQGAESREAAFERKQQQPAVTGLAAFVRNFFTQAQAARQTVENRMLDALYARRGQYTTEKLQLIAEQRQPAIYMLVASSKMRQIEALLRDVYFGSGNSKPWTVEPTPDPQMPPEVVQTIMQRLAAEIEQAMASGFMPSIEAARERARQMRDEVTADVIEEAQRVAERAERKMHDQMVEGGAIEALDQFITDLATFPTAFIAGPIVRRRAQLKWPEGGGVPEVVEELTPEWERIDPFDMYPAAWATDMYRDPMVRKHRLTRTDLEALKGTKGFDNDAIDTVLERYGVTGHREMLAVESQKQLAEGKDYGQTIETGLIDTLQFWGSVSGKMLQDWGVDKAEIPDATKQYEAEVWMVGSIVIKAALNPDPLARRPYYGTSFQPVPGSVWGNSPYDLCRDCQDMCNAAARALAANMGISSGPQVAVLANRIPGNEDVTEMFPWKIWQFESDPMGSTAAPIQFFQPQSNANELMAVFDRFSMLADEYVGVPRYMAGFNGGDGGAGRTASGMSMMIGNASKTIKQVVAAIDMRVLTLLLQRLYHYNRMYLDDPDLRGDLKIVANGVLSLQTREAAQVRNNEFLQVALNSPIAQSIMGMDGVAEILRGTVRNLDHNPNKVVPSAAVLKQRMAMQQAAQMMAAQQGQPGQPGQEQPGQGRTPEDPRQSREQLQNGAPTTDNFSPKER
jgi:hypothetical protein